MTVPVTVELDSITFCTSRLSLSWAIARAVETLLSVAGRLFKRSDGMVCGDQWRSGKLCAGFSGSFQGVRRRILMDLQPTFLKIWA